MNGNTSKNDRVNHPTYYQGENGIETIEIIRHYTCNIANALKYLMRAGKKQEMGMDAAEKEIEDLKKALFYIEDYRKNANKRATYTVAKAAKGSGFTDKEVCEFAVEHQTGHSIEEIRRGYKKNISAAMYWLLQVGIIDESEGRIFMPRTWKSMLMYATHAIHQRILDIETAQKGELEPKKLKEETKKD